MWHINQTCDGTKARYHDKNHNDRPDRDENKGANKGWNPMQGRVVHVNDGDDRVSAELVIDKRAFQANRFLQKKMILLYNPIHNYSQ